jgi:hypothetical protein
MYVQMLPFVQYAGQGFFNQMSVCLVTIAYVSYAMTMTFAKRVSLAIQQINMENAISHAQQIV